MRKFEPEDVTEVCVKTEDLGRILGVSGAQIRQLKMRGILTDSARGYYPLAASIQAYARFIGDREGDSVKAERAALLKAQREALEQRTLTKRADHSTQVYQTAVARAVVAAYFLGYRLIPSWLFTELQAVVPGTEARRISGLVARWQISIRAELDRSLTEAVGRLNAEGRQIISERDLAIAIDPGNGLTEYYSDNPDAMRGSEQAMLASVADDHDVFAPPADAATGSEIPAPRQPNCKP